MIGLASYSKVRHQAPIDTSRSKSRHYSGWITKRREYVTIPGGTYTVTWRGASEIITRYVFPKDSNFSLQDIVQPENANYVLAVSWYENDVTHRYKLWENVGEIFWEELYSGQTITADTFALEVWSTNVPEIVVEEQEIYTSRLIIPTTRCDTSDVESTLAVYECGDPIFHIVDDEFNPSAGDYYIFQDYCTRIIVRAETLVLVPPANVLYCQDDDTWHNFWMHVVDGNVGLYIDPTPTTPEGLGYLPIICIQDTPTTYKFWLELIEGNYHFRFDEDISGAAPLYGTVEVPDEDTPTDYYTLQILEVEGDRVLSIGQTPV